MGKVFVAIPMAGTVPAAERLWYDTDRWPTFVDGFHHVVSSKDGWPEAGGRLTWDSTPQGRGRVAERVTAYERGVGQTSEVEDPEMTATQRVTFEQLDDGVGVRLDLEYQLKSNNPLRVVTDWVFIRRAQRDSLRRTLERFAAEQAAEQAMLR